MDYQALSARPDRLESAYQEPLGQTEYPASPDYRVPSEQRERQERPDQSVLLDHRVPPDPSDRLGSAYRDPPGQTEYLAFPDSRAPPARLEQPERQDRLDQPVPLDPPDLLERRDQRDLLD